MNHQHKEEKVVEELIEEIIEDIIEIEEYVKAGKHVPKGKHYRIRVDKEHFVVKHSAISGKEILALVQKTPELYHLYQHIRGGQTKAIQPGEHVDLTAPGVERFTTLKIENTEGAAVRP